MSLVFRFDPSTRLITCCPPTQRLQALRTEADNATLRAEEAESKVKKLEQALLEREQEVKSLEVKNGVLEDQLEKTEKRLSEAKSAQDMGDAKQTENQNLERKIALLESELDQAEATAKEQSER